MKVDLAKLVPLGLLRIKLADYLQRVIDGNEEIIITKHGRPCAVLIPFKLAPETPPQTTEQGTIKA